MGSTNTTRNGRAPRRGPVALILVGALALAACGGDDDDASSASGGDTEATMEEAADFGAAGGDSFIASDDTVGAVATEEPTRQDDGGFDIGVIGRDVIIEMRVVLSSDDIQRTVASIMASTSTLGGGVASSDVNYGNGTGEEGYAVLVVQVPPESVDRLLSGLGDTGTVQSINQSARDVTEQLVDLAVRIDNARRSVDNVREFMDRTENLNELVTLEAELTRRQTDLEQLEAQQRNLSDRVALSTITIEVVPAASVPEPADEGGDSLGDAMRSGWDAFTAMLFGVGYILAAMLPFLISGLLLALIAWMIVRRSATRDFGRTRSHGGSSTGPSAGHESGETAKAADANEPEPVG